MAPNPTTSMETLTVLGRPLLVQNTERPLAELRLDPGNPRLRHEQVARIAKGKTLTEMEIEEILWKKEEVKRLYQSIRASRGLTDRLYVTPNGRTVEGNERLVALRKIAEQLKKPGENRIPEDEAKTLKGLIGAVPCKILPLDVTTQELDILLARWHVSGKDEWPALEQAAHVYKLMEEDGFTAEQIAELLGVSKTWVYQRRQAYEWTEDYLATYGREKIQDFSFFEELYKKRKQIAKAGLDVDTEDGREAFMRMVNNRDIPTALDVRKLPKLLSNKTTSDLLRKGDGKRAMRLLPDVDPSEFSPRFAALEAVKVQLRKMTREDLEKIEESRPHRQLLEDVKAEIEAVLKQVK